MIEFDASEWGVGGFDIGIPIVQEMRARNLELVESCTQKVISGFDRNIIEKLEARDKFEELETLLKASFFVRIGAHIIGAEQGEADEKLFAFLDEICPQKFEARALSDSLDYFYQAALATHIWQESTLAARAEKAGASTEPQR